MFTPIRLIVGLGNPGKDYALTRHNAGARWLRDLALRFNVSLRTDRPRHIEVGRDIVLGHDVRLLVPSTFMNNSGSAIVPFLRYFKIKPAEMLVAFDEVDFDVGVCKLKQGGGASGHNGLKSIIQNLNGVQDFGRLRIGVGHPNGKSVMVKYLTQVRMPTEEQEIVNESSFLSDQLLDWLLAGDWQRAMTGLHSNSGVEA